MPVSGLCDTVAAMAVLATNRRVFHDYEIRETCEAGIVLNGQEVKSAKNGRISLQGAYVIPRGTELYLMGASIPPWQPANLTYDYAEQRPRKLLLRRNEIDSLLGKSREKGLTIVPTRVYTSEGLVKVEVAVAKGKKKRDKRRDIREREEKRKMERTLKEM